MAKTPTNGRGRDSLYRGKGRRYRVQGVLSNDCAEIFERVRARLAKQIDRKVTLVSDADVIERAVRHYDEAMKHERVTRQSGASFETLLSTGRASR